MMERSVNRTTGRSAETQMLDESLCLAAAGVSASAGTTNFAPPCDAYALNGRPPLAVSLARS